VWSRSPPPAPCHPPESQIIPSPLSPQPEKWPRGKQCPLLGGKGDIIKLLALTEEGETLKAEGFAVTLREISHLSLTKLTSLLMRSSSSWKQSIT